MHPYVAKVLHYGRLVPCVTISAITTGGAIRTLIDHPKERKGLLKYSVYGGLTNTAIFSLQNLYFKYASRTPSVGPARMKPWLSLLYSTFTRGTMVSLGFFALRPFIARVNEIKVVPEKQLSPAMVSSLTGGIVGMTVVLIPAVTAQKQLQYLFVTTVFGMGVCYVGHHIVDRINKKRLRVATRLKYPELTREYDKAEKAIANMYQADPMYDGPIQDGYLIQEAEKMKKIREQFRRKDD